MTWNDEMRQFVAAHLADDTSRLLLSAHRFPGIDVPFAVEQIEARRRLRTKLPEWYALDALVMGGRVPAEQCSSEQTARFKRSVMLPDARSLCDMTGGMGVDFWYMSRGLERAIYTERQPALCAAARHNFGVLSAAERGGEAAASAPVTEVVVREGLSTALPIPDVDVIYLDPARRSTDGSRIYEISECEPDVVAWQDELLSHCRQLITKVSPMADITRSLSRLHHVTDVYVLSVRNECKELLIVQQPPAAGLRSASASAAVSSQAAVSVEAMPASSAVATSAAFSVGAKQASSAVATPAAFSVGAKQAVAPYRLHCLDFFPTHTLACHFTADEMVAAPAPPLASAVGPYFYEPDVSLMKCQPFGLLAARYGVEMLGTDCHYFTSQRLIPDFPGRVFEVDAQLEFSSKALKRLRTAIPQANIAARGFPMTADQLRQRTAIRDGGEVYLFGVTLQGTGPLLLRCHKPCSSN